MNTIVISYTRLTSHYYQYVILCISDWSIPDAYTLCPQPLFQRQDPCPSPSLRLMRQTLLLFLHPIQTVPPRRLLQP